MGASYYENHRMYIDTEETDHGIAFAVLFLWLDSSAEILLCSMSYWVISEFLLVIAVSLTFY